MERNAGLFLAGATLVGGFAIGKAALDHYFATQRGEQPPLEEATEDNPVKDVVSFVIFMVNVGYLVTEGPKLWESWSEFGVANLLE